MDRISQKEHSSKNRQAWNHRAYEAWHRLGGSPEEAANKIRQNPHYPLREYEQHLGDVANKRIANLLGSHGRRAVALSLLGARVTVVDISEENCRYAMEFAQASGVELDYIVSDVMEWDCSSHLDTFDIVLMELGLLHYFVDLNPLTGLIHRILKPGGKFVLHEYHPVNKKCLIESDGDRWTLAGDYFSPEIVEGRVPYWSAFPEEADTLPSCRYRYWQIGEVVTAVGSAGLLVETLTENPHKEPHPLPATLTLVARK